MSQISLGLSHELMDKGIAVNCLWSRTAVATAAVANELGGESMTNKSRLDSIMGDSAYEILTTNSKECTGQFFIDDEVLASVGCKDFSKYRVNKSGDEDELFPDFFLETRTGVLKHLSEIEQASRK